MFFRARRFAGWLASRIHPKDCVFVLGLGLLSFGLYRLRPETAFIVSGSILILAASVDQLAGLVVLLTRRGKGSAR